MPKSHSVALVGLVVFLAAAHGLPSLLRTDAEPSPVQQEPDIHFHFLLDRSGSMHHLKEDVLGGLNSYIAEQQRDDSSSNSTHGGNVFFSLIQFDSVNPTDVTVDGLPIQEVKPFLDYQPRGGTPLYDAIGNTVTRAEETVAQNKNGNPELPVIIIFTDGDENQSREWDRNSIAQLIKSKEAEGWTFVFLGANQDAFAEGGRIGLSAGSTQNYAADGGGVRSAFTSMAAASRTFSQKARRAWTDAEDAATRKGDMDTEAAATYKQMYRTKSLSASQTNFFEGNHEAQQDFERRTAGRGAGGDL